MFTVAGLLTLGGVCAEDVDGRAISGGATEVLLLQEASSFDEQEAQISAKYGELLSTEDEDEISEENVAEEVGRSEFEGDLKPILSNNTAKPQDSVPNVLQTGKSLSNEASTSSSVSSSTDPQFVAVATTLEPSAVGLVDGSVVAPVESATAPKWFSGNLVSTWEDGFAHVGPAMQLNQAWLSAERKARAGRGQIDFGGRVDATFGSTVLQSLGDRGFDGKWGITGDGYGASIYQAYGELATGRLSMKVGKFATLLEYEPTNSVHHGFNTHTYAKEHEPETHSGVLFEYRATEKFALKFGLTAGSDVSFENRRGDSGLLFGVGWELSERIELEYAGVLDQVHSAVGENRALLSEGYYELGGVSIGDHNDYLQTCSFKLKATERLTYGFVHDWGVMSDRAKRLSRYSQLGLGFYVSYAHNDMLTSNLRYERYSQRLGSGGKPAGRDERVEQFCHDLSYGLVYKPTEQLFIRPEVRYDWIQEPGKEYEYGLTGGVGCGLSF